MGGGQITTVLGASHHGTSPTTSAPLQEALLRYDWQECQPSADAPTVEEVRSMGNSRYFDMDHIALWKPALLGLLGEVCQRAVNVNGYHVLLCSRRLVLVNQHGGYLVFPPFDDALHDAYAERVSETCTLVLAGIDSGVFAALVRDGGEERRADTLQSVFCPTASPVMGIHHLKKHLYGLCCSDCTVESLQLTITRADTSAPALQAGVLPTQHGWMQTAVGLWQSKRRYVHSFFDRRRGCLLMLSKSDVSVWAYSTETHLQRECSAALAANVAATAVALLPSSAQAEDYRSSSSSSAQEVATLITESGSRVPVYLCDAAATAAPSSLSWVGGRRGGTRTLALGKLQRLPSGVSNTVVSLACACESSLLLGDRLTSSFVLITRCEPFCEAPDSAATHVVTQHFLGKPICGVGVERSTRDGGSFLTFVVYCADSTIVRLGRMPRGQLLLRLFAASALRGTAALSALEPQARVDLVLDAALSGLPTSVVSQAIDPILHPRAVDARALQLSEGARGILRHTMRGLGELSRLCSSFHYWRLTEELGQARSRLDRCRAILTEVLDRGGWLECPAAPGVMLWDRDAILLENDAEELSVASAVNAQAAVLQLVLTSMRDATTIAWLYDLLLDSGAGYRFPGRLEDLLWRSDPEAVQVSLCMQLLARHDGDVARALLHKQHALPLRCRLASTLLSLVVDKALEPAMAYARQHIRDLMQCDLLSYTTDLLEANFPTAQPRIRLLIYQYPHRPGVSTELVAMLEPLADNNEVYNTLLTILGDAACDSALSAVMLDWMERHDLADPRLATFARVVVDMGLEVDPAHTLTGRFFSATNQQAAGHAAPAAARFADLARSELSVPLEGRLLAVARAIEAAPSDEHRLTEFLLLLQQQLASLISEHLTVGTDLVYPRAAVEADLRTVRESFIKENPLFDLAGRYRMLGGCSIQLDLLKIHPDATEDHIAAALTGVLTFLKAVGLSAAQAVRRVLQEYLDSFQAPLPLFPFIEFLAFNGQSAAAAMSELETAGVALPSIFDAFMCLLDAHCSPLFRVGDMVLALARVVPRISPAVQHICAAHLLECSRSMLAGEQRAATLSDEDVRTIQTVADEMRTLSQRSQASF